MKMREVCIPKKTNCRLSFVDRRGKTRHCVLSNNYPSTCQIIFPLVHTLLQRPPLRKGFAGPLHCPPRAGWKKDVQINSFLRLIPSLFLPLLHKVVTFALESG